MSYSKKDPDLHSLVKRCSRLTRTFHSAHLKLSKKAIPSKGRRNYVLRRILFSTKISKNLLLQEVADAIGELVENLLGEMFHSPKYLMACSFPYFSIFS